MEQPDPAPYTPGVLSRILIIAGSLAGAILLTLLLRPLLDQSVFLFFYPAIALSAWYGGLRSGIVATIFSVAIGAFFVQYPHNADMPAWLEIGLRLALFLMVALIIQALIEHQRRIAWHLEQERERFAVTLASTGDAIITTDAEAQITFLNRVAEELTGWTNKEAFGQPLTSVFPIVNETTRLTVENPVTRTLREGRIVGLANHTILLARDGQERPIDDSSAPIRTPDGRVLGAVLVFRDISERRRQEHIRQQLEERTRMQALRAQTLADASKLFNTAGLDVQVVLERVVQSVADLIGDTCTLRSLSADGEWLTLEAVHHPDPAALAAIRQVQPTHLPLARAPIMHQALQTGASVLVPRLDQQVLDTMIPADYYSYVNRFGVHSLLAVPLRFQDTMLGVLNLSRDTPHRPYDDEDRLLVEELAERAALAITNARLYEATQQAREGAERALQARDQFLSIASHELRTPLTALKSSVDILVRRAIRAGDSTERDQRLLQVIQTQAQRLNMLIETLLDVSRLQLGRLVLDQRPLDLCELVRRGMQEFELLLDRHTMVLQTEPGSLMIHGDEIRLEQVIFNLLQNAVKYSPHGGTITIEVVQREDVACVSIHDQGIGIPIDAQDGMFDQFYRASNVSEQNISGMGVGLYVVKEIVTRHNGSVSVQSVEGQGSTFTVCLPLLIPSEDRINHASTPEPGSPG